MKNLDSAAKASMLKHKGDYLAAAAERGERPSRFLQRWTKFFNSLKKPSTELVRIDATANAYLEFQNLITANRNLTKTNSVLRKNNRLLADSELTYDRLKEIAKTCAPKVKRCKKKTNGEVTHEWLFGDLHYGKRCAGYDHNVAETRITEYRDHIEAAQEKDKPAKTVIAFMGDIVENAHKHRDSRSGSDMDTAEQIVKAAQAITDFLANVYEKAGALKIICVAGNHENPMGGGSMMNNRGLAHYSYIVYQFAKQALPEDIEWVIPKGVYATAEVAGKTVCYEHGDNSQPTDKAMAAMMGKRSQQAGKHISRYRQGDKHVSVIADAGNVVCNGAFFSDRAGTEFSGAVGYCSEPCQVGFRYLGQSIDGISICRFH